MKRFQVSTMEQQLAKAVLYETTGRVGVVAAFHSHPTHIQSFLLQCDRYVPISVEFVLNFLRRVEPENLTSMRLFSSFSIKSTSGENHCFYYVQVL